MWKGLNVLIGVSGNGRYLTRLINQSGVKRLEARIAKRERQRSGDRERERGQDIGPVLCVKQGPSAALSSCLASNPRHPLTPSQLCLSHTATQPQGAKRGCSNN